MTPNFSFFNFFLATEFMKINANYDIFVQEEPSSNYRFFYCTFHWWVGGLTKSMFWIKEKRKEKILHYSESPQ